MLKLLLPLFVVASLAGCKSHCRQLSEKQCDCAYTSTERTNCLSAASTHESGVILTAEDEATCEALLPQCDCRLIDTPEGKANCGLARPLADADAGS
jgi:hypothetical protein